MIVLATREPVIHERLFVESEQRQRRLPTIDPSRHRALQVVAHNPGGTSAQVRVAPVPQRQQDLAVARDEDPRLGIVLIARLPRAIGVRCRSSRRTLANCAGFQKIFA